MPLPSRRATAAARSGLSVDTGEEARDGRATEWRDEPFAGGQAAAFAAAAKTELAEAPVPMDWESGNRMTVIDLGVGEEQLVMILCAASSAVRPA
jgi:hypothetical protein